VQIGARLQGLAGDHRPRGRAFVKHVSRCGQVMVMPLRHGAA
jgi:hypothetical protein